MAVKDRPIVSRIVLSARAQCVAISISLLEGLGVYEQEKAIRAIAAWFGFTIQKGDR